jgi:uncharacterized membrane protein YjgN (DUF898 family)
MTEQSDGGAPATPAVPRRLQVEFTGTGGEYFRIWIVNLLLTFLTIGIYSAWAKVRRMQYFYRNTRVDGAVFDYHGRPWAILKGRIIVLVLVLAYNVSFRVSLVLGMIAALALASAMPWLLAQSQRFRLYNSSYRGLRFRFLGSVREAYLVFGIPLLVLLVVATWFVAIGEGAQRGVEPGIASIIVVVLGYVALLALWPYLHYRFKKYQHANSAFGGTRSAFAGKASRFYLYYAIALATLTVVAVPTFGLGVVLFYVALLAIGPFLASRVQNHVWNSTRIGPVAFESAVKARRLIWIVISNLMLIALTLGLFTPFAVVRATRYKLQSIAVLTEDDLANFAGASASEVAAVGEGAADLFDVDFAL